MNTTSDVPATIGETAIWTNLVKYAEDARGAFAPATERAIRSDIAAFTNWCDTEGRQAMPASPETVVAFIDAMAVVKATATVRRYVSSVSAFHRAAEVVNPCAAQAVKLALKRMHNARGRAQHQAEPLNEGTVRKLLEARGSRLRDIRNRALLVLAYVTLCRRSELTALRFEDLSMEPDGFGTILIRRSKGDQEGAGAILPVPQDAAKYVTAWVEAARIEDVALFRAVRYSGSIGGALDPGDVARIFKTMARRAGLPAKECARISGHSTRVGSAQDMLRYKETLPAIMASGRWKSSEMVGRYVAKVGARESAAKRIADQRPPF